MRFCSSIFVFIRFLNLINFNYIFRVPSPYIYGSPYLGATAAANSTAAGLVPLQATQLTQAALAAATNQFYEYQVSYCIDFNLKKTKSE